MADKGSVQTVSGRAVWLFLRPWIIIIGLVAVFLAVWHFVIRPEKVFRDGAKVVSVEYVMDKNESMLLLANGTHQEHKRTVKTYVVIEGVKNDTTVRARLAVGERYGWKAKLGMKYRDIYAKDEKEKKEEKKD